MSTPLLSVEHLHIAFGKKQVVKDVSFSIDRGARLGMVGESGSGKSLTALSMIGLLPRGARVPTGRITWVDDTGHYPLQPHTPNAWRGLRGRKMSMVFQEPMSSLNPVLKCGRQIREAIKFHFNCSDQEAKERVLYWMDRVGLTDLPRMYRSYPHQLSGGQKQRIMIAMALCGEPDLLIADEPTTALDLRIQEQILDLLLNLSTSLHISLLFISHDLAVVQKVADKVVVMEGGMKVEEGRTTDLFRQPQTAYTKGLLACRPPLHHQLHRLPTIGQVRRDGNPRAVLATAKKLPKAAGPLLEGQNISVHFSTAPGLFGSKEVVKAVNEVDLQLYPGETLGLVGESGSGKTTLGRCLIGLQDPALGSRYFRGQRITRRWLRQPANRRSLQIIFQDPFSALNPRLTVGAAIAEPLRWKRELTDTDRLDRTVQLLEQVGLSAEHLNRYPGAFSGGQRQRICIARALAAEPQVLVCDESVSALDVSVQAQVLNLLKDIQERHQLTYLFISHDLGVIRFMCDRVMVMKDGKIVESGQAEDIFTNPQVDYTRELLAAVPKS